VSERNFNDFIDVIYIAFSSFLSYSSATSVSLKDLDIIYYGYSYAYGCSLDSITSFNGFDENFLILFNVLSDSSII